LAASTAAKAAERGEQNDWASGGLWLTKTQYRAALKMHLPPQGDSSTPSSDKAALLTIWYDRHCCWVQARTQHCVLLAGVAHAYHVLHISQHCLDELVGGDASSVRKAKQGVVSEYHLHALHRRTGSQSGKRPDNLCAVLCRMRWIELGCIEACLAAAMTVLVYKHVHASITAFPFDDIKHLASSY
jgi:hypothetical protein